MESRLAATQWKAEEVKDIMQKNMDKAEERGEKLEELEERSENLKNSARSFLKTAIKLKEKNQRKKWRSKNILIPLVTLLVLVIITVGVALIARSSSETSVRGPAVTIRPPGHP